MVPLPLIRESNLRLKSQPFGINPTAVFVGATQGIGLSSLEQYAAYTVAPTIYIVGRSESVGAQIIEELRTKRNAEGRYVFLKGEVSLLRSVDEVCAEVKRREKKLDLLFMSPGTILFGGREETSEGLDIILSLRYYARIRFLACLLPLLQTAPSPRVVSILAAGKEGPLIPHDLELKNNYSILSCANHGTTMMSLFFEEAAARKPEISFVHAIPGIVKTGILTSAFWPWFKWVLERTIIPVMTPFMVPLQEAGERSVFDATSSRYPPRQAVGGSESAGVPLPAGSEVATGAGGERGAYLLSWNGEEVEGKVMAQYRKEGLRKEVWDHTMEVFERVRGKSQGDT